MPCPTCGHTLAGIGHEMFYCERCGTLVGRSNIDAPAESFVPKLVLRCRQFASTFHPDSVAGRDWHRLGIAESIHTPDDRRWTKHRPDIRPKENPRMDGYLVLGRCLVEDIPLRLCATPEDARGYSATVTRDDILAAAGGVMDSDASVVCAVWVVPFEGGRPGRASVVKTFDDEGREEQNR